MKFKNHSMFLLIMVTMILFISLSLTGCDGNGLTDGTRDVDVDQSYEVGLNIDGLSEETVNDLIIIADETYDQLGNYLSGNEIDITLNLNKATEISFVHPDLEFKPSSISVTEDNADSTIKINTGKSVNNLEELNTVLSEGIIPFVLLDSVIDLNNELVDLDINREVVIDGRDQYGFEGDGSISIRGHDSNMLEYGVSFKDLYFKPGNPITNPEVLSHKTYMHIIGSGAYSFYNIEVTVAEKYAFKNDILESFARLSLDSEAYFVSLNSTYNLGDIWAFDMNNGFNSYISNNIFIGEPRLHLMRTTNSPGPAELTVKNNDFSGVEVNSDVAIIGSLFELQTNWHQENVITFNSVDLHPVNNHEEQNEVDNFFDNAKIIHNQFSEINTVPNDYYTTYVYGENLDPYIEDGYIGYQD